MAIDLYLLAEEFCAPAGLTADGARTEPDPPVRVPGFVESGYSPLIRQVVARCLAPVGKAGLGPTGEGTALVLASTFGDTITTDLASELLTSGKVQNPLLFYQSVPTTILGVVAREHGITGPTTCVSTRGDLCAEAFDLVDILLADAAVDQVLLIAAELAAAARPQQAVEQLTADGPPAELAGCDVAVAFLLRRPLWRAPAADVPETLPPRCPEFGSLGGFVQIYLAARTARTIGQGHATMDLTAARGRRRLRLHQQETANP